MAWEVKELILSGEGKGEKVGTGYIHDVLCNWIGSGNKLMLHVREK